MVRTSLFTPFALVGLAALLVGSACGSKDGGAEADADADADETGGNPDEVMVVHAFGKTNLEPYEETLPCASWTLHNEKALYVKKTDLLNEGMYHHSTWFAVPESAYDGPDGFWDCEERGFDEVEAAVSGAALIAQSTQSIYEEQEYGDNTVVKIPPFHRIVAQNHMLNVSNREVETGVTMTLHLMHPRDVNTVLIPFRFIYKDLHLPPQSDSDWILDCDLNEPHERVLDRPLDMKLHFALPHTHDLGRRVFLDVVGGPRDGERIVDFQGFNAQGNGISFDPPVDLTGATGLRATGGFTNPRDEEVVWGIGDQEMFEILVMADSGMLVDLGNHGESTTVELDPVDGVLQFEAPCDNGLAFLPNSKQKPPTEEEIAWEEIYVPPIDPADADIPPIPVCEPFDESTPPLEPITLTGISENIFAACTWASCHGNEAPQAGLDLTRDEGLHDRLMNHNVAANTSMPLVDPGNPDNSWLYQRISECAPVDDAGNELSHMPVGSPLLMYQPLIATTRAWIEAGAPND